MAFCFVAIFCMIGRGLLPVRCAGLVTGLTAVCPADVCCSGVFNVETCGAGAAGCIAGCGAAIGCGRAAGAVGCGCGCATGLGASVCVAAGAGAGCLAAGALFCANAAAENKPEQARIKQSFFMCLGFLSCASLCNSTAIFYGLQKAFVKAC